MAVGKRRILPGNAVPASHQPPAKRADRITVSGYMVLYAGSGRQMGCTQRLQGITGQSRRIERNTANRKGGRHIGRHPKLGHAAAQGMPGGLQGR